MQPRFTSGGAGRLSRRALQTRPDREAFPRRRHAARPPHTPVSDPPIREERLIDDAREVNASSWSARRVPMPSALSALALATGLHDFLSGDTLDECFSTYRKRRRIAPRRPLSDVHPAKQTARWRNLGRRQSCQQIFPDQVLSTTIWCGGGLQPT